MNELPDDATEVNNDLDDEGDTGVQKSDSMSSNIFSQKVFDRLNESIEQNKTMEDENEDLSKIGAKIRQWRISHCYTRAQLAEKIGLGQDILLCLERGISLPADISRSQWQQLQLLLSQDDSTKVLKQTITAYLDKHDL